MGVIQPKSSLFVPQSRVAIAFRIVAAIAITTLHVRSFFLPVFTFESNHGPIEGFDVLSGGCCGILGGEFGWYANPFFWTGTSLLACGRYAASCGVSTAGLLIALTSWGVEAWYFNEAHPPTPISGFGDGFYVWFASMVVLAVVTLIFLIYWTVVGKARPKDSLDEFATSQVAQNAKEKV